MMSNETWHNIHGGWERSGGVRLNVLLLGSPNNFGSFGIDLRRAHEENFGRGVRFEYERNEDRSYRVNFILNLVTCGVFDDGTPDYNSPSYVGSGTMRYLWRCVISTSTNNQISWNPIFNDIIFDHPWNTAHIYSNGIVGGGNWQNTARLSQWNRWINNIPSNTTHIKIEIAGHNANFHDETIFPLSDIIPEFRPMAIRQGSTWRSLDNPTGFLNRRSGNSWEAIPLINRSVEGALNEGSSRIRRNTGWHAQSRIGE